MKRQIITLCGSSKFKVIFENKLLELSVNGYIVFTLPVFSKADNFLINESDLKILKQIQKDKIEISDILYVINPDGYIGEDTKQEIDFANSLNKEIVYYQLSIVPHSKVYNNLITLPLIFNDKKLDSESYDDWFEYINLLLNKMILSKLNKYEKLEFAIKTLIKQKGIIKLEYCKTIVINQFINDNNIKSKYISEFLISLHSYIVLNTDFTSYNTHPILFIEDFLFNYLNIN